MRSLGLVTAAIAAVFALTAPVMAASAQALSPASTSSPAQGPVPVIHYRYAMVDGVRVFYREAGPPGAPVVLLLHGFPASSRMFRNLIPLLADRYRVIAPDYPGFGHSEMPDRATFKYSFAHYADVIDDLTTQIGATRYALYVMDYGAPVGYRLALKRPERVSALIVQNGNAYEEGFGELWATTKAYWADNSPKRREATRGMLMPDTTIFQYTDGMEDRSRISPDNWVIDQALLDRPGNDEIQMDLFLDYATNVSLYPKFQAYFRDRQPPTLILWGKNDRIFPEVGAHAYLRDLPDAETHLLNSGHFALEDQLHVMAPLIREFLDRKIGGGKARD